MTNRDKLLRFKDGEEIDGKKLKQKKTQNLFILDLERYINYDYDT